MINWYEALKAQNRIPVNDRLTQLFGATTQGPAWKTITGVLPLTFTAKGGNVADWVIYGNDDNGTENLFCDYETFPNTHTANLNLWISYDGTGTIQRIKCEANTEYTLSFTNSASIFRVSSSNTNDVPTANNPVIVTRLVFTTNSDSETFTTPNDAKYLIIQISTNEQNLLDTAMLVKGSTAPDHYIPYQKGVGERTENLWDSSSESLIKRTVNDAGIVVNTMVISVPGTYTARCFVKLDKATTYCYARMYNVPNNTYGSIVYLSTPQSASFPLQTITATVDADNIMLIYDALGYGDFASTVNLFDEVQLCIVKGSTAPSSYIPYGYQVPITVSQTGQPDKTYDIYIGDSPLTEGEMVSKTSTGVDIELFEGENVVSTMLYNKPEMEIKYK